MGQQEVIDFLKKNPGQWFTNKDLCDALNTTSSTMDVALRKLRHMNLVGYRSEDTIRKRKVFEYRYVSPVEQEFIVRCRKFIVKEKPFKRTKKSDDFSWKEVKRRLDGFEDEEHL